MEKFYYIHSDLPAENQDMLDGPRIVCIGYILPIESDEDTEGPYKTLKDLRHNSTIYNKLLKNDPRRAGKIIQEKFIVNAKEMVMFPANENPDFEKIIYRIMQHSANGTIKGKDVKGIHLFDPKKIKILRLTAPINSLGLFKAKIEVLNERTGKWIVKEAETTFFPTHWNWQQLVNECYHAFQTQKKISESEASGITSSGVKIVFHYSQEGILKTVYPIYEQST